MDASQLVVQTDTVWICLDGYAAKRQRSRVLSQDSLLELRVIR
ncbi:MAG TPA: hypothetical protein V6D16_23660 [Candidatus Obscuribacterales bacterium]